MRLFTIELFLHKILFTYTVIIGWNYNSDDVVNMWRNFAKITNIIVYYKLSFLNLDQVEKTDRVGIIFVWQNLHLMDEVISSIFSIKKKRNPWLRNLMDHGSIFLYIQYRNIKNCCHITLHDINTYIYMPAETTCLIKVFMTNGFKLFSFLLSFFFNLLTCVWVGLLGVLWVRFCPLHNISNSSWTFKEGLYGCK